MYDINSFFERLDWFYENHRLDHAENFMREQLKTAGEEGDYGAQLSIINELMGFLRTQGRHRLPRGRRASESLRILRKDHRNL